MRTFSKLTLAAVLSTTALGLVACQQTKEVTHNTTAFVKGGSSEIFEATPAQMEIAIKAAAEDLHLVKTAEATETDEGKTTKTWTFRSTADDKKVVISVTGLTDKSTRVNVSNGPFGDTDNRQIVLGKIRQHANVKGTPTGV